jgi:hypothetical protein
MGRLKADIFGAWGSGVGNDPMRSKMTVLTTIVVLKIVAFERS